MAFVDTYVKEIIALEVALFHARARLESAADAEALHDLRIAVRRIRSLLIPVRAEPAMARCWRRPRPWGTSRPLPATWK